LIHRIALGEEPALAALYRRRGSLVYAYLLRLLGQEDEAKEALQDTFVRLWRRAGEFDERRSSATGWLILFARGIAMDRLRARSRHAAKLNAYQDEINAQLAGHQRAAPDSDRTDLAEVCLAALQKLPEPQAQALKMAFLRGWTHEEIAAAQGEPLGTVKARIRRGLLALRQAYKETSEQNPPIV